MTDPKPCPFCGPAGTGMYLGPNTTGCAQCNISVRTSLWNSRPIEDRLRAALWEIFEEALLGVNSPKIREIAQEALK